MSSQPERLADTHGNATIDSQALVNDPRAATGQGLPIDSDVRVGERLRGRARARHLSAVMARWDILLFIAAGGSLGGAARYGIGQALPHTASEFPWATFLINVTGSFALGVLMVLVLEVWTSSRYLRPFFGVGLLGGYTTFSAYVLETRDLLVAGQSDLAGLYLLGSLAAGLVAVWLGIVSGRLIVLASNVLRRHRVRRRRAASARAGRSYPTPAEDVNPTATTGRSR